MRLYFPEWEGYGVHDGARRGAELIRRTVCATLEFTDVEVAQDAELATADGIVGRASVMRNTRRCLEVLEERRPDRLFTLGGTCAVELGPVSYLNRLHGGDLAVVWLDAHADLNTPASSPSGHFHGMPLRTLLGEGDEELVSVCQPALRPEQVFLVGARDLDPPEVEYARGAGLCVLGVETNGDQLVRELEGAGFGRVYVHLDLDVLEPGDFDEAICPVPGGMRYEGLLEVLGALRERTDVVGSSLLEFVPGGRPQLARLGRIVEALEG
jgi:arginase